MLCTCLIFTVKIQNWVFCEAALHRFHKHHVSTVKVTVYVEIEPQVLDAHV